MKDKFYKKEVGYKVNWMKSWINRAEQKVPIEKQGVCIEN